MDNWTIIEDTGSDYKTIAIFLFTRETHALIIYKVIGAAWYWHFWSVADAFITRHPIECSIYITSFSFARFYKYPLNQLYDLFFKITKIENDESCIITNTKILKARLLPI